MTRKEIIKELKRLESIAELMKDCDEIAPHRKFECYCAYQLLSTVLMGIENKEIKATTDKLIWLWISYKWLNQYKEEYDYYHKKSN